MIKSFLSIKKRIRQAYTRIKRNFLPSSSSDKDKNRIAFLKDNKNFSNYQIDEWTYGTPRVWSWNEDATLKIGKFCSIAAGVEIFLGGEHHTDWISTYPFNIAINGISGIHGHPYTKGDVIIGNDVWIGHGALILSGIKIGNGSVIAAKSVVTKDVDPYSIVAGNPARLIRFRFSKEVIEALERIEWWNWPLSQIIERVPWIMSDNVAEFAEKFDPQCIFTSAQE